MWNLKKQNKTQKQKSQTKLIEKEIGLRAGGSGNWKKDFKRYKLPVVG